MGFITVATGDRRYYLQAELLAISLKTNMPGFPVALITDRSDVDRRWFSHIIPMNSSLGGGIRQKMFLDQYTPFEETLFIDSDCIVTRDFAKELNEICRFDFSPVCEWYLTSKDVDLYVENMEKALTLCGGSQFPKFNGGVYYFKKTSSATKVFDRARLILADYKRYGVKDFNRDGPGEETIFSLALASLNIANLYNDRGKLMRPTINVGKPFVIEPLGGGCRFKFYDQMVEPAICHFVRNNAMDYHYRNCEWALRRHAGQLVGIVAVTLFLLSCIWSYFLYKLKMLYFVSRNAISSGPCQ